MARVWWLPNDPGRKAEGSQAVADKIMDGVLLPEAHLGLSGVYVYVHLFGRDFKEKQHDRKTRGRNHIAIGLAYGVQKQPVANQSLVHKNVDRVAIQLLQFRL